MRYEILKASSVAEAFQVAVEFLDEWAVTVPPVCWFRGVHDATLPLTPSAYWERRKGYDEYQTLLVFVQEAVAFREIGSLNEWPTYYLAQHHGIPTRLLDWTESFSAALFFAFDGWDGRTTPCIWILQPSSLNEVVLGWHGVLAPEKLPEAELWLPSQIGRSTFLTMQDSDGVIYDNKWPLAIYPKKVNQRLHAQQGAFTVHGRQTEPLDKLLEIKGAEVGDVLVRIDLKKCKKDSVLNEMFLLGIRRSAIYPDIDNFVRQMKDASNW